MSQSQSDKQLLDHEMVNRILAIGRLLAEAERHAASTEHTSRQRKECEPIRKLRKQDTRIYGTS